MTKPLRVVWYKSKKYPVCACCVYEIKQARAVGLHIIQIDAQHDHSQQYPPTLPGWYMLNHAPRVWALYG